ncbi:MAG: SMI1/KNR4 family protein [Candidatus Sericytochromatia bacterium]
MKTTTLEKIEQIESKYPIKIPIEHKNFLLNLDSPLRYLDKKYYMVEYGSDKYIKISELYDINKIYEFIEYFQDGNKEDSLDDYELEFFEKKLYNIGETYEEFDLCISYSDENYGKVYFTNMIHDNETTFLANNFDEFMLKLTTNPD